MAVVCKIVETPQEVKDGALITVFGLEFFEVAQPEKIIKTVWDIFTDKKAIVELQTLINQNALEAVHIDDVIEDALQSNDQPHCN